MKLYPILVVLALFVSIEAQYFSAGWAPGQPIPEEASPTSLPEEQAPASKRISPSSLASYLDLRKLLTSELAVALFSQFGVNITEKVQGVLEQSKNWWDERVPLITDNNYEDLIVNEPLTEEEERDRTWIIVM